MNTKYFAISLSICLMMLAACATPTPQIAVRTQVVADRQTAAPAATRVVQTAAGGTPVAAVAPSSSMIIKDADMELLVQDTDQAMAQITQMAADDGGYLLSSQTWYTDGLKYASLRLGVPAPAFEKTLNYLRHMSLQVLKETTSGQDVSAEYTDLQSKLTNLEATAARVREFLKNAQTVEDSLRINGQLSELEGQIEQVKGQMNYYEGRAAVSTISLSLRPQTPVLVVAPTATPTPTPAWNPGHTFTEASGVLVSVTQNTVDGLIWIVVVLGPMFLVGFLLLGGALRLKKIFKR